MTARDMVIAMLLNNIESMEKDVANLEMTLENKREQLEGYYDLLDALQERG